jgi:hypothetical protein
VGLGGTTEEFTLFGEEADPKIRAERLDEALTILTGLWTSKPFAFDGKHYHVDEVTFLPPPQQQPRIPIWVAGFYPHTKPFYRAAKFDGVFPTTEFGTPLGPADLKQILTIIKQERGTLRNYEVVVTGSTENLEKVKNEGILQRWREEGATWWLEMITDWIGSKKELLKLIKRGPPDV